MTSVLGPHARLAGIATRGRAVPATRGWRPDVSWSFLQRVHRRAQREVPRRVLPVRGRPDLERLGNGHCSWLVAADLLSERSICWCAGVGEEISFDLALIQRFGCRVWGLDPTPRALRHAEVHAAQEPRFQLLPVGLWSEDTTLRFFPPEDPSHVSHSVMNLQGTRGGFDAACRSAASLSRELGHDRIDLLKLNVEGAEYEILESLRRDDIRPRTLCVVFDQPATLRRMLGSSRTLIRDGYTLIGIDGWSCTFVRE